MKKIYLLLTVLILTLSCQKEEIIANKEKDSNLLSTVDEKEALHILSREKSKNNFKSQNETYAVPDFENLHYKEITNSDALLTIIPASVPDNAESQILMLKIENEIQTVVLSMYPDSQHNIDFSGVFIIRNLYGNFKEGYRVENGRIIAKLVKTKSKLKTGWEDGDWNDGELGEVIVDAPGGNRNTTPVKYVFVIRIHDEPGRNGEDWEFEYSSGGGGGGTTTTPTEEEEEEEEEDKIDNNLTDPCARTLFKQLLSGIFADDPLKPEINLLNETLNFNEAILALFSESTKFHYTIENGDLANPKASAHTIGSTITLNNLYLSNATELSIARTIIHETLHTYLNLKYQNPLDLNNMSFRQKMDLFASEYGFNPNGDERDKNRFHHEFMGQYVDAMAYSLYEWDKSYGTGGNLGWDYYYKMAAAGLSYEDSDGNGQFTDSFYALFTENEDIQEVIDITNNEKEGNDKAKGTKC